MKILKRSPLSLALLLSCGAVSLHASERPPLAELIPAESLFFFEVAPREDIDELMRNSPFYTHRSHPLMVRMQNKLEEWQKEINEEIQADIPELDLQKLTTLFTTPFGFAMTQLPQTEQLMAGFSGGDNDITRLIEGFIFFSHTGDNKEEVEQTLALLRESAEEEFPAEFDRFGMITILETEFSTILPHPDAENLPIIVYGFDGDTFLAAVGEETFARTLEAFRAGRASNPFANQAAYFPLADLARSSDSFFYFDLQQLIRVGLNFAHPFVEQAGFLAQIGMTFDQAVDVLGLRALTGVHYATSLHKDHLLIEGGLGYGGKEGLLSLMTYGQGPAVLSPLIPGSAYQGGFGYFDTEAFWLNLLDLIGRVNPMYQGMVMGGLETVRNDFGLDIENGLIRALGTESFTASLRGGDPEAGEDAVTLDTLIGLSLRNQEALQELLAGVRQLVDPEDAGFFRDLEFLDSTITTIAPPFFLDQAENEGFHYAFIDNTFVLNIGSIFGLQEVIRQQANRTGPAFADLPEVQQSLALIEGQPSGVTITRLADGAGAFLQQIREMTEITGQNDNLPDLLHDPLLEELLGLLFRNARSALYDEPNGLIFRYWLEFNQP